MARGRFITLEGGEGAGKSTLSRALAGGLSACGLTVQATREPGGSPNAEAIRTLLLGDDAEPWAPISETLLLYAARADHVARRIEPALARGEWVICDRFSDSTRAYQGAAGGLAAERIAAIEAAALGAFTPDLTLILDLDPEAGLARAIKRGEINRFERQGLNFHKALRQGFLDIARAEPNRCVVIDTTLDKAQVKAAAMAAIEDRLGLAP